MPRRRKCTSPTDECRASGDVSKNEESHCEVRLNQSTKAPGINAEVINRLGTQLDDEQNVKELQKESLVVTASRQQGSRRRGSNAAESAPSTAILTIQVPGSSLKAAESSLKATGGLDSEIQMAVTSEVKALNVRSSARTRKVICYNEQSPASHPSKMKPPIASKPKARAAAKRNASAALPLSGAAKKVKEDPTSTLEETLAQTPMTTSHVKRGSRRDQGMKLLQSHQNSAGGVTNKKNVTPQEKSPFATATISHAKRGRVINQELKLQQNHANEDSPLSNADKMKPPIASKPKARAAAKRNASAALPPSGAAKKVKEDQTSSLEETLAQTPMTASQVKRGSRRDQGMKLLQSHVNQNSAGGITNRKNVMLREKSPFAAATISHVKRGRVINQELKLQQSHANEDSPLSDADKHLLQKTPQMSSKPRRTRNTATTLEPAAASNQGKMNNMANVPSAKMKSGNPGRRNQRKKQASKQETNVFQSHKIVDESASSEAHSMAVMEVMTQDLSLCQVVDEKFIKAQSLMEGGGKRESNASSNKGASRQMALSNATQNTEVLLVVCDALSEEVGTTALPMDPDKKMNPEAQKKGRKNVPRKVTLPEVQVDNEDITKVLKLPSIQVAWTAEIGTCHNPMPECKSMERGCFVESTHAGRNPNCQTQRKGKKTVTRKRTQTRQDDAGNPTGLGLCSLQAGNGQESATHSESEEKCVAEEPAALDRKLRVVTQEKKKKAAPRKLMLQETIDNQEQKAEMPLSQGASHLQVRNSNDSTAVDGKPENGQESIIHTKPKEKCSTEEPATLDKKLHVITQEKKKEFAPTRKRALRETINDQEQKVEMPPSQGASNFEVRNSSNSGAMDCKEQVRERTTRTSSQSTQQCKKLKILDSLCLPMAESPEPSIQKFVEGFEDAEEKKASNYSTAVDVKTQTRGKITTKRTLIRSTQQGKKPGTLDSLCLPLTATSEPSMQKLDDEENQEHTMAIQDVDPQHLCAIDAENFPSKAESSSKKKRKEEGRRKRAMRFDFLPVGFGLGISCWSPSPLKCQDMLQEVTSPSEVRYSVVDIQAQLDYPLGTAEKQPFFEEIAMADSSNKNALRIKDMNIQLVDHFESPAIHGGRLGSDPDEGVSPSGARAKVNRRQVGDKRKKVSSLLVAKSQAVRSSGDDMLDKENLEPGIDQLQIKKQERSRRRAATRTTRSTKQ